MRKIVITDPVMGTLEYTPGPTTQHVFDNASPDVAEVVEKWMTNMLRGYLIFLTWFQGKPNGMDFVEASTNVLVNEVDASASQIESPSETMH